MVLSIHLYGQEITDNAYSRQSSCPDHNAFLTSWRVDSLEKKVDKVKLNGTIYFEFGTFNSKIGSLSNMNSYLGLSSAYTFQYEQVNRSRLDTNKVYARYQQYYNGIKVEGGGYTVSYLPPYTGPVGPAPGPVGPPDPCDQLYAMNPYVLSNIDVNTTPTIDTSTAASILSQSSLNTAELVISYNINAGCQYNLAWKVTFSDSLNKKSWVDAHTGQILKTIEADNRIIAPTTTYCNENLHDSQEEGITMMTTPDGHFNNNATVSLYSFGNDISDVEKISEYTENRIPATTGNQWTNEEIDDVYQTYFVTEQAVHAYSDIDIDFGNVHVGHAAASNAFYLGASTFDNTYIWFGYLNGASAALFDIAAHELGHSYLDQYISLNQLSSASLHEGISDILGTFIESQLQQDGISCI